MFLTARESAHGILHNIFRTNPAWRHGWPAWLIALGCLLLSWTAEAGGTWTPLTTAPPSGLQYGLVMSDGTVICANGGNGWYRLTPDIHGSYINGTWSQITSMNYSRLFFSSDVLTNGNVYVAGGEYGGGPAELYDTLANTWTVIPPSSPNFSDACLENSSQRECVAERLAKRLCDLQCGFQRHDERRLLRRHERNRLGEAAQR